MIFKKSINTKQKIIDVAIDLFAQNGYTETSVREIADQVGIKASSIYNHFAAKEALLAEILGIYIQIVRKSTMRDQKGKYNDMSILQKPNITAKNILKILFFRFSPEDQDKSRKILKVINNEMIRNHIVRRFYQEEFLKETFNTIKYVLDILVEEGKIPTANTMKVSGLLCSTVVAFSTLSCLNIRCICMEDKKEETSMFGLLEYLLNALIEGGL